MAFAVPYRQGGARDGVDESPDPDQRAVLVVVAVPQPDRTGHATKVEIPVIAEYRYRVVDPSLNSGTKRFENRFAAHSLHIFALIPLDVGGGGVGQLNLQRPNRIREELVSQRPEEVDHSRPSIVGKDPKGLAIEPDQILNLTWEQGRRRRYRSTCEHAMSKFGRTCERVRATARAADNQEAPETECVRHGGNVARGVTHPASWQSGRPSIAGPVDRYHVQTQIRPQRRVGMSIQPAARAAMEEEHRPTVEISPPLISNDPVMLDRNSLHCAPRR